jgi:DNA polymerase-3 subunit delta
MEPRELERHLRRKEIPPVMLLWGEETLLIDETIQRIDASVLDPAMREFNRDLFYGDEADAQTIYTAAKTVPWLASHRLVVVKGAEALPRAEDALLNAYCKQPSPTTCLIFTSQRIDAGRPLFATLSKLPAAVRFRRLLPGELSAWIEQRIQAQQCRITPDAVAALIEAVGNDLRLLASEIEKLVTCAGAGATIEPSILAAMTGDVRETSVFDLARHISAGDLAGALRAWEKLASSGEYPGLALGAIVHHVRQLWRLKLAQQAGTPPERCARELNIPLFSVRRLSAQAMKLEPEQLRQWLDALLQADQRLKRSSLPPQTVFEGLILRLCLGKRTT